MEAFLTYGIPIGIILLVVLGAPLYIVFASIAMYAFHLADTPLSAVIIEMVRMVDTPTLAAIPMFTFAGYMMAESKTPERLVNLARATLGWLPGGFALVCIVACSAFTALTGASGVTIIAMGGLLMPLLLQEKYDEDFSLGLVTSCGSLGLLFIPSLPVILYTIIANNTPGIEKFNIDELFLAGFFPGILLMIVLGIYSIYKGKQSHAEKVPFDFGNMLQALRGAVWELPLPIIIVVGIFGGLITASEAAAVTAFYIFVIEVFIYRDLNIFKDIPRIAKESMILVGSILIILAVALGFTSYLVQEDVPNTLLNFVRQYIDNKLTFLLVMNIFLLIVGCLMDIFSAIIIIVPLLLPIANSFGIHPLHMGIIFLANLEIGYLTPPVGINLFISSIRFKKNVLHLYRVAIPFLILLTLALIIITYWPDLSLWLPKQYPAIKTFLGSAS